MNQILDQRPQKKDVWRESFWGILELHPLHLSLIQYGKHSKYINLSVFSLLNGGYINGIMRLKQVPVIVQIDQF